MSMHLHINAISPYFALAVPTATDHEYQLWRIEATDVSEDSHRSDMLAVIAGLTQIKGMPGRKSAFVSSGYVNRGIGRLDRWVGFGLERACNAIGRPVLHKDLWQRIYDLKSEQELLWFEGVGYPSSLLSRLLWSAHPDYPENPPIAHMPMPMPKAGHQTYGAGEATLVATWETTEELKLAIPPEIPPDNRFHRYAANRSKQ